VLVEYRGRRTRSLSREVFFRLARRFTPVVVADRDGYRFFVETADRAVGLKTFVGGPQEKETLERCVELLKELRSPGMETGATLIEIGANIGTTTVTAVRDFGFGKVVCFEPLPANYELLLRNIRANGLEDRVRPFKLALSDREGEAEFEISAENSGDGRVRDSDAPEQPEAWSESGREVTTVQLTRLDTLIDRGELDLGHVGLAWVDAQGHEAHILAGAEHLLEARIPIVIELWPYGLRRAGGLERLMEIVQTRFIHLVDLSATGEGPSSRVQDSSAIGEICAKYGTSSLADPHAGSLHTDLLLLP
jgi:FkbM family methyltransferase